MSTGHSSPFENQHTGTYQEHGLFSVTGAHLHPPLSDIHRTSFTFTGKERDEETGYGYFSPLDFTSFVIPSGTLSKVHRTFFTRYMDADLFTGWLSVDPMADKYPNLSPYNYCAWNPIKLVDPKGKDWYQKGNDYYWSNKVVNKKTTPKSCSYIGRDNALLEHFGFPDRNTMKSSQWVQTLVGTNAESDNPYVSKWTAFANMRAEAKSTVGFTIQMDKKTGKLLEININATLNSKVSDLRAGGSPSARLEVSYGNKNKSIGFLPDKQDSYKPLDCNSYINQIASVSISANQLSPNCVSKLQIKGVWFSQGQHMSVPFTLGIVPCRLKHDYLN